MRFILIPPVSSIQFSFRHKIFNLNRNRMSARIQFQYSKVVRISKLSRSLHRPSNHLDVRLFLLTIYWQAHITKYRSDVSSNSDEYTKCKCKPEVEILLISA